MLFATNKCTNMCHKNKTKLLGVFKFVFFSSLFFFLATAKVNTVFKPKKYKTLSCHSTNDCNNYSTTVWHNEENENFYNKTELKILLWQFLVWFVNMYPYYGKACNIIIYIISKPASSSSTAATAAAV